MTATRLNSPLAAYPVGSIYMSVNSTSPATLFGGTWERITGRFLLGATDGGASNTNGNASQAPGSQAGEASHALTPAETAVRNHSHTMAHDHNLVAGYNLGVMDGIVKSSLTSGWSRSINQASYSASNKAKTQGSNTANTGGQTAANGSAHNNMPPFLAVYIWKRTA